MCLENVFFSVVERDQPGLPVEFVPPSVLVCTTVSYGLQRLEARAVFQETLPGHCICELVWKERDWYGRPAEGLLKEVPSSAGPWEGSCLTPLRAGVSTAGVTAVRQFCWASNSKF